MKWNKPVENVPFEPRHLELIEQLQKAEEGAKMSRHICRLHNTAENRRTLAIMEGRIGDLSILYADLCRESLVERRGETGARVIIERVQRTNVLPRDNTDAYLVACLCRVIGVPVKPRRKK